MVINNKEIKDISVNEIDKYLKSNEVKSFSTFKLGDSVVYVKRILSPEERIYFVADVVGSCFYAGNYQPEYYAMALKIAVIEYYTNIRLPLSDEKKYEVIYHEDIMCNIFNLIDPCFYDESVEAIKDKIEYRKEENIASQKQEIKETMAQIAEYSKMTENFGKQLEGFNMKELFETVAKLDKLNSIKSAEANLVEAMVEGENKKADEKVGEEVGKKDSKKK